MDKMLEKLKAQEARLVKEQQSHLHGGKIKLSPRIDFEEKLRNGYITAEGYRKSLSETSAKLIVQNLLISSYFCTFIV